MDPALYGREPHPKLGRVDRRRDEFELALTREALARDLPLLAICRGQQVLNVATGGTLVQDIPSELKGAVTHDAPGRRTRRSHTVEVTPGSRLARDSRRGHAVREQLPPPGDRRARQGARGVGALAEGRRDRGRREAGPAFVVGVQWHPESFWNAERSFQGLFDAHARACRTASLVRSR